MDVCMYVNVYVCAYIYIERERERETHTHIHIYLFTCLFFQMYAYTYVYVYMCVYTYMYVCMHLRSCADTVPVYLSVACSCRSFHSFRRFALLPPTTAERRGQKELFSRTLRGKLKSV